MTKIEPTWKRDTCLGLRVGWDTDLRMKPSSWAVAAAMAWVERAEVVLMLMRCCH